MKRNFLLGLIFSFSFAAFGFDAHDEKSAYQKLRDAYHSQETPPNKRALVGNREYTLIYERLGTKSMTLDCSLKTLVPWEPKKDLFCKTENGTLVKAHIGSKGICVKNPPTTTLCFRNFRYSPAWHLLVRVTDRLGKPIAYGFQVR